MELVQDGKTGFLVGNDNADEWAAALRKLRDNPVLLGEMRRNAREYALANFSLEKMVRAYEQVYAETYHGKFRRV